MKKHDEGYALVFVLVVMTVLGIVALTLMTGAAKNLNAQADSVSQMQDKYLAQGEIEKVVSLVTDNIYVGLLKADNKAAVKTEIEQYILDTADNGISCVKTMYENNKNSDYVMTMGDTLTWLSEDEYSCQLALHVQKEGSISIDCLVTFRDIIQFDGTFYRYVKPTIVYDSYTIDYTPPAATKGG